MCILNLRIIAYGVEKKIYFFFLEISPFQSCSWLLIFPAVANSEPPRPQESAASCSDPCLLPAPQHSRSTSGGAAGSSLALTPLCHTCSLRAPPQRVWRYQLFSATHLKPPKPDRDYTGKTASITGGSSSKMQLKPCVQSLKE